MIIIKENNYVVVKNGETEKVIGKIENNVFSKIENTNDIFKKYCCFTIHKDILPHCSDIVIKTEEAELSILPSKVHKSAVLTLQDEDGSLKYAVPLSKFDIKITTENASIVKRINNLGIEWYYILKDTFQKPFIQSINKAIKISKEKTEVYPESSDIFRAFKTTPFSDVRVCIIGQDPYHTPGVADGLAFSSKDGLYFPPSLKNIFKEIENDLYNGLYLRDTPDLTDWAEQGVLLINTTMTVEKGLPNSHVDIGWREFTKDVIRSLYYKNRPIVWLLWGKFAQTVFYEAVNKPNNAQHVLIAPHPSPFSASTGFFGCRHFSKTNEILKQFNQTEIKW
jgi:uracil-DNA glycosylase